MERQSRVVRVSGVRERPLNLKNKHTELQALRRHCRALTKERDKLQRELDHLWRKVDHRCIDMHCPICDGPRKR